MSGNGCSRAYLGVVSQIGFVESALGCRERCGGGEGGEGFGEIGDSDQRSTSPREERIEWNFRKRYEKASGLSDRLLFVRKCRLPLSGS